MEHTGRLAAGSAEGLPGDKAGDDIRAIKDLIARQFAALNWGPGKSADWDGFAADFFPEASLYPAARPAKRQSVAGFVDRMRDLAGTELRTFSERVLGTEIRVFGNIAVAVAACEMTENDAETNRSVEMMLLIKEQGAWRIVSQAWDTERASEHIPDHLVSPTTTSST